MVLLGDLHQVEARFGLFGDSIKLGVRWEYGLPNVREAWKSF
jgi:hypothetical protein